MDRDNVLEFDFGKISKEEKIRLLEKLTLHLCHEMETQDENMHPDVHNKLVEELRMVTKFTKELRHQNKTS